MAGQRLAAEHTCVLRLTDDANGDAEGGTGADDVGARSDAERPGLMMLSRSVDMAQGSSGLLAAVAASRLDLRDGPNGRGVLECVVVDMKSPMLARAGWDLLHSGNVPSLILWRSAVPSGGRRRWWNAFVKSLFAPSSLPAPALVERAFNEACSRLERHSASSHIVLPVALISTAALPSPRASLCRPRTAECAHCMVRMVFGVNASEAIALMLAEFVGALIHAPTAAHWRRSVLTSALEATQGQNDSVCSQIPYTCYLKKWHLWEIDLRFAPGLPPGCPHPPPPAQTLLPCTRLFCPAQTQRISRFRCLIHASDF